MPVSKKINSEPNHKETFPQGKESDCIVTLESLYREFVELKSYVIGNKSSVRKRPFNNKTLSEYLNVSTRTLQNWRDEGLISFTQIKDVIFYSEEDVELFMKKHKRVAFK